MNHRNIEYRFEKLVRLANWQLQKCIKLLVFVALFVLYILIIENKLWE